MKNIFKILFMAASAMTLMSSASCDKEDDGGSAGGFHIRIPNSVIATTLIRVDLAVNCDTAPTVTFTTEDEALGVVSPTENAKFGTPYVYADEPIDVNFTNGRATATFWYIPLTPGEHTVTFQIAYTRNGKQQLGTNRQTLTVEDKPAGGFYPEVHTAGDDEFGQNFYFRNEVNNVYNKHKQGCAMYLCFGDVDGQTDPAAVNAEYYSISELWVPMEKDVFYSVNWSIYDPKYDDWGKGDGIMINAPESNTTMNLIFRDNFNRCRDVQVDIEIRDGRDNVVRSSMGEYYLWPRDKK